MVRRLLRSRSWQAAALAALLAILAVGIPALASSDHGFAVVAVAGITPAS
jgi:hypothetical protein